MRTRLDLDKTLREIIGNGNVYFQPPENLKMNYPCIRYSLYDIQALHGDNLPYIKNPEYQLILIDPNPDNEFVGKLAELPSCSLDRVYVADNLNHYVFTVFI